MLKKLQRKFILINMSLVGSVLLLVFTVLVISNYRQNVAAVENAMHQALQMRKMNNFDYYPLPQIGRQPDPDKKEPFETKDSFIPTVSVTVDAVGNILIDDFQMATIDETILNEAVMLVLSAEEDHGILSAYDLRYMRSFPPQNAENSMIRIVFADRSYELSNMRQMLASSLLVGAVSLVALFIISYFLSKLAIRPVGRAWEQQRQFVADASHELKTPLTVILANISILQSHATDTIASQKQWIDSTKAEGQRMKLLIEEMLFLAKSDADRLPLSLTRIDLSDALWNCLLPFEAVAYEHGLTIDSEISPNIFVDGDESALKRLFLILLDNACKYSESPGVITIKLKHNGVHAILSVHNTGEPIPIGALPHIFDRFYRADASRVRAEGGYGLGLAIAKTIADAHSAAITASSNADMGTTFTFEIPLSKDSN